MASLEKAAFAFEAPPLFLREERFFVLEDPFADLPKVLRVIRFLVPEDLRVARFFVAMRLSLAQKRRRQSRTLYVVWVVL